MNITLSKTISFEDIARWNPEQTATFQVAYGGEFPLLTEHVAIGQLHSLARRGVELNVKTIFPISMEAVSQWASATNFRSAPPRFGLLTSTFGLALIANATSVRDSNDNEIRDVLHEALWRRVYSSRGILTAGARQYVVFRDPDYSIPQCLRETDRTTFPRFSKFHHLLTYLLEDITSHRGLGSSQAENQLLTFLYEATLNAHEHARPYEREPVFGLRSIIVEKAFYPRSAGLDNREQMPAVMRPYIKRVWDQTSADLMFGVYTITDVGPGIHRTLPAHPGESDWERLNRALRSGESRKPRGSGLGVGQGFSKILTAARELNGFLFVQSAGLAGYTDFTPIPDGEHALLNQYTLPTYERIGSALTLLWPLPPLSTDQQSLFDELELTTR